MAVENLVDNCIYYEDDGVCQTCDSMYLNNSGVCYAVVAQNCLTWKDINACETCSSGDSMVETDGVIDCASMSIQNCSVTDTVTPYDCLQCSGDYYPNG